MYKCGFLQPPYQFHWRYFCATTPYIMSDDTDKEAERNHICICTRSAFKKTLGVCWLLANNQPRENGCCRNSWEWRKIWRKNNLEAFLSLTRSYSLHQCFVPLTNSAYKVTTRRDRYDHQLLWSSRSSSDHQKTDFQDQIVILKCERSK